MLRERNFSGVNAMDEGIMTYEIRIPKWSGETSIDLEWNHPDFGWIPFTCVNANIDPWTAEPDYMREIWDALMRGDYGPIEAPE